MASPARPPLIAANWKMHLTPEQAVAYVRDLRARIGDGRGAEVLVLPSYPCLPAVAGALVGSPIRLGAQNLHWETEGAFTGEVSASILRSVGCAYVLVGHSERRRHFDESDRTVNRKVRTALEEGLRILLCVGEAEPDRTEGRTQRVIEDQIARALEGVSPVDPASLNVAYEPVWAIGTGRDAPVGQVNEAHGWIREELSRLFPGPVGESVRILYGGSVTPENVDSYMASPLIEGVLVGGASLRAESFARIVLSRRP
ncbi:MAG: triose-phosphate isomerase [Acidobacteria bacterium]|nr:triose-phosphate isomerase [Acidobacteriota bacterium]